MTKAYICDKCGKIIPADVGMIRAIWTKNPFVRDDGSYEPYHFCGDCYERFKKEYLANLRENGGIE